MLEIILEPFAGLGCRDWMSRKLVFSVHVRVTPENSLTALLQFRHTAVAGFYLGSLIIHYQTECSHQTNPQLAGYQSAYEVPAANQFTMSGQQLSTCSACDKS